MSADTLTRETGAGTTAGGDNFDNPPPPELFTPDGEGDDYYSINDGIDQLEMHANEGEKTQTKDHSELPPGTEWRGYEFTDLSKTNRLLGDVATTGFDRSRPISDYGMPRVQTRRRIARVVIPRVNY